MTSSLKPLIVYHPMDDCRQDSYLTTHYDVLVKVIVFKNVLSTACQQVWLGKDRKLLSSSGPSSVFFDHHIHSTTILSWCSSHQAPIIAPPACYARHIDWDVCIAARKQLPLLLRASDCCWADEEDGWVLKHTSGFCSVGTNLVKWKEQPAPDYSQCVSQAKP
jgi:hypothetical protein